MFKFNNKDTRTASAIRSGVFIVNFQYIWHLVLIVTFEHVIHNWECNFFKVLPNEQVFLRINWIRSESHHPLQMNHIKDILKVFNNFKNKQQNCMK